MPICRYCGRDIPIHLGHRVKRIDSAFCDAQCKNDYHMGKRKIDRALKRIEAIAEELGQIIPIGGELGVSGVNTLIQGAGLFNRQREQHAYWKCTHCDLPRYSPPQVADRCDDCQHQTWYFVFKG